MNRGGEAVTVDRVSMVYPNGVQALDDVSFQAEPGEFVSLLGASGCGKSTMLMNIAGLIPSTSGEIRIGARRVDGPETDVGIVFQEPILLDWMRVLDNVMLQVEARRLPYSEYLPRAQALLERAGLSEFEGAYPYHLSGGMSQRVSVCRALVHDPPLLLMDEPFGALDALTRDQMILYLQSVWSGTNKTVIFVTHSITEAVFLSDKIVVFTPRPGRIERVIQVPLPHPRRLSIRSSREFQSITEELVEFFKAEGVLSEDDDSPQAEGMQHGH